MRNRRFVKVAAVVCGLSLLAAACGSDDDSSSDDTTTTTAADGGGTAGELSGAKGTTPAPETTAAVTSFQEEMQAYADAEGIEHRLDHLHDHLAQAVVVRGADLGVLPRLVLKSSKHVHLLTLDGTRSTISSDESADAS